MSEKIQKRVSTHLPQQKIATMSQGHQGNQNQRRENWTLGLHTQFRNAIKKYSMKGLIPGTQNVHKSKIK